MKRWIGFTVGMLIPGLVMAQTWPGKPIRIVIAQAPGSATDVAVGKTLHNGGTTEHDVYLAWLEIPELRRYQYGRFMELLLTFLLEIDPMAVFLTFP